jgi:hypothetical protein
MQTQRQFMGRELLETVRVSEYVPNRTLAFQFSEGSISGQNRLSLEPVEDATRITATSEVELGRWLKWMIPILRPMLAKFAQQNLADLKRIMEATG